MSYNVCEAALATIVKLVSGYTVANVSQGDYRVLGAGVTKAVILTPGRFTRETAAERWMRSNWVVNMELYVAFGGEISTVASNIRSERQNIIDKVDQYPTLNSATGVVLARLTGGDEPEVWQMGAMQFWKQILYCEIQERAVVTYA